MKSSSIVIGVMSALLFGCGDSSSRKSDVVNSDLLEKKEWTADSLFSADLLRNGDSLIKSIDRKDIEVYVQTPKGIVKVTNGSWPDAIEKTYNLINKENKPLVYIEVPYSESGDWNNTYTYYFDKNGKTRAMKIVSSFFNSQCVDGALTEETRYLYDQVFNVISKAYNLHDEEGKTIQDTSKCIFNYHFEYPVYEKSSQVPLLDYLKRNK